MSEPDYEELTEAKIQVITKCLDVIGNKFEDLQPDQQEDFLKTYDIILDRALKTYNWSFAKKEAKLERLLEDDEEEKIGRFKYKYGTPTDFVKLIDVYTQPNLGFPINTYERRGNILLANDDDIYIEYIAKVAEERFNNSFILYFACEVALNVVYKLNGDDQTMQQLIRIQKEEYLREAIAEESKQNPLPKINNPFYDVRD